MEQAEVIVVMDSSDDEAMDDASAGRSRSSSSVDIEIVEVSDSEDDNDDDDGALLGGTLSTRAPTAEAPTRPVNRARDSGVGASQEQPAAASAAVVSIQHVPGHNSINDDDESARTTVMSTPVTSTHALSKSLSGEESAVARSSVSANDAKPSRVVKLEPTMPFPSSIN